MSRFEVIAKYLDEYWGFRIYKNTPDNHGWFAGDWKTGYTVLGKLHGNFCVRFNSLKEIERSWMMKDHNGDKPS